MQDGVAGESHLLCAALTVVWSPKSAILASQCGGRPAITVPGCSA